MKTSWKVRKRQKPKAQTNPNSPATNNPDSYSRYGGN